MPSSFLRGLAGCVWLGLWWGVGVERKAWGDSRVRLYGTYELTHEPVNECTLALAGALSPQCGWPCQLCMAVMWSEFVLSVLQCSPWPVCHSLTLSGPLCVFGMGSCGG